MWKYTMEVKGMRCGMCEAHMNEAIRRDFKVKKVTSSHTKNETVIISEDELDEQALKATVTAQGYDAGAITKAPHKKWFLFG